MKMLCTSRETQSWENDGGLYVAQMPWPLLSPWPESQALRSQLPFYHPVSSSAVALPAAHSSLLIRVKPPAWHQSHWSLSFAVPEVCLATQITYFSRTGTVCSRASVPPGLPGPCTPCCPKVEYGALKRGMQI